MNLRLNLFNFILLTGTVNDIQVKENGTLFFLKQKKLSVPVMVKDERLTAGLKNGDSVCVRGRLRYSSEKQSMKIIAGKVNLIVDNVDINLLMLEAYSTGVSEESELTRFGFRHMALNNAGTIYGLPIDVIAFGTRAQRVKEIIQPNTLYLIEGRLGYDNSLRQYSCLCDHVTGREAIMREVVNV